MNLKGVNMIPPNSLFLRMCPPINLLDLDTETEVEMLTLAEEMVSYLYPETKSATMREIDFCSRLADLCLMLAGSTPVKLTPEVKKMIQQLFEVRTPTLACAWLFNFFSHGYAQRDEATRIDGERVRAMQIYRHLADREGTPLERSVRDHFINA